MEREVITLNGERDVTLTTYTQRAGGEFRRAPRRPAVLILPGGGYAMCSEREADPVAFAYLAAGFQAFVLRYSVGKHAAWPNPRVRASARTPQCSAMPRSAAAGPQQTPEPQRSRPRSMTSRHRASSLRAHPTCSFR